ncbi:MAG: sortase [Chloroflexota bacterium]
MLKSPEIQQWIVHIAILFGSLVWTLVTLSLLILFWIYQAAHTEPTVTRVSAISAPISANQIAGRPDGSPTILDAVTPTELLETETGRVEHSVSLSSQALHPPTILPETALDGQATPIVLDKPDIELMSVETIDEPKQNITVKPTVRQPIVPTHLEIPAVGIDADIIPVGWQLVEQNGRKFSIWEVADFAVGWHQTTAHLGQRGNTVLAAHHNMNGEVFRDLPNVEIGDTIIAYADGQPFEYTVETKTIVKELGEPLAVRQQNAQWIAPTTDERLTLVSCWPYNSNSHRIIVIAKPA